jgi:hypothetical protein
MMAESGADNIPRLDKMGYLYETLGWIDDEATFDEIRQAQIAYRRELDRDNFVDKRSGVSSARLLQKHISDETYWTNVRATLSELMRLGLVEIAPVPSRKEQLQAHRARRYQLTAEGVQFVALMDQDFWRFQDLFAQAFIFAHPLLRQLLTQLAHRELFIPRLGTDVLRDHLRPDRDAAPSLLSLIEDVCAQVRDAGGPDVAPQRLLEEFEPGMLRFWSKCDPTLKHHDFHKSVVKAFNDQLLRAMIALRRIPLNVVDLRAAVALLAGIFAVDSSHVLIGRTGWTIWSTSEVPPSDRCIDGRSPAAEALASSPWFSRRVLSDVVLRDEIVGGVHSIPNREGGFALIHEVRAEVCHEHHIHSHSFNELLRKMHRGEIKHAAYRIYLDRGGYAYLPPSELPFSSGGRDFYLITFIPSEDSYHGTRQQIHS